MMAQSTVTETVSRRVFQSRLAVSERQMRCQTLAAPAPAASVSRKARGSTRTATTRRLAMVRAIGRRARRVATGLSDRTAGPRRTGSRRGSETVTAAGPYPGSGSSVSGRSKELHLAQKRDRLGPGAELGDVDRVRLQLRQRRLGLNRPDARGDGVLEADRVGDDLLALLGDEEGEELLGGGLVLGGLRAPPLPRRRGRNRGRAARSRRSPSGCWRHRSRPAAGTSSTGSPLRRRRRRG